MENLEDMEVHKAVESLHKTLKVLRNEIILKNKKIEELEERLINRDGEALIETYNVSNKNSNFHHLFELVIDNDDATIQKSNSWKNKVNTGSQTDIIAIHEGPSISPPPSSPLKREWASEPLLSIRPFKSPPPPPLDCYSRSSATDIFILKSLLNSHKHFSCGLNFQINEQTNDEDVDVLLAETRDYLEIASQKLVTLDDWDELSEKKKRRTLCQTPSSTTYEENEEVMTPKSKENVFIPMSYEDLEIGNRIRFVENHDMIDGIVKEINVNSNNDVVESIVVVLQQNGKSQNNDDNDDIVNRFRVYLNRIVCAWRL